MPALRAEILNNPRPPSLSPRCLFDPGIGLSDAERREAEEIDESPN
jgi:hypothetical protein